ncbi:MAG: HDOD domain-containing protein [Lentisphaerota bacterium]
MTEIFLPPVLNDGDASRDRLRAEVVMKIRSFPSMPAFVGQVITLLSDPNADVDKIALRIKFDAGMTANILRLANSAEFGSHRSVRSLQEAIVRLGLKQLFQLVVACGMGRRLSPAMPGYELQPFDNLRHSLWTALAAEEFCKTLDIAAPDMLFTAGLLHDIGKMITDEFILARKSDITGRAKGHSLSFDDAEMEVLGICHAQAGAEILDAWHFPKELVACTRWHHRPEQAGEFIPIASIVHIAEFLGYAEGVGTGIDGLSYRLSQQAIDQLGIRKTTLELVASHTLKQVNELEQLLKN